MAWSWSHSQQAYADAEENLRNLPKETLEIIFAEWRAAQGNERFGTGRLARHPLVD